MFEKLMVVLHNVQSVQRVVETAKVTYGLGFKNLIVSKAAGSAAQSGVPEAQRIALKLKRNFFYLADLPNVLEVFKPVLTLMFVSRPYGEEEYDASKVFKALEKGVVALVFGGAEPGLSRRELDLGIPIYVPLVEGDIGVSGLVAIVLYKLLESSGGHPKEDF